MFSKPCYRTLDRPLSILGLDPGDLVIVVLSAIAVFVFVGHVTGIALGLGMGLGLRKLKRNRPPGHLYYLAYRHGILRLLPSAFRVAHLVMPPLPWQRPVVRYSPFSGDSEHDRPEYRFFHLRKPRLG